jgi:hypothetical protein
LKNKSKDKNIITFLWVSFEAVPLNFTVKILRYFLYKKKTPGINAEEDDQSRHNNREHRSRVSA